MGGGLPACRCMRLNPGRWPWRPASPHTVLGMEASIPTRRPRDGATTPHGISSAQIGRCVAAKHQHQRGTCTCESGQATGNRYAYTSYAYTSNAYRLRLHELRLPATPTRAATCTASRTSRSFKAAAGIHSVRGREIKQGYTTVYMVWMSPPPASRPLASNLII